MDIRRWLAETVPPIRPASPLPTTHRPQPPLPDAHSQRELRIASSSDTSYLQPAQALPSVPRKRRRSHSERVPLQSGTSSPPPRDTDDRSSEHQSVDPGDRYKRKPRRKPRPDLYHHLGGKARKKPRQRTTKQDASTRKSRRDRRSRRKKTQKDSSRLLATNFHAENIARDRLTLKPTQHLGLFRNGRASSPKRGRGLPDLTFSEMKFLQKRRGREGSSEQDKEHKEASRKIKRLRGNDAEISEFFAANRPPLRDKDPNIQTHSSAVHNRGHVPAGSAVVQQGQEENASVRPTVELPDEAYLGFGSRGSLPAEASPFSWSESAPPQKANEKLRRNSSTAPVGGSGFFKQSIATGESEDQRIRTQPESLKRDPQQDQENVQPLPRDHNYRRVRYDSLPHIVGSQLGSSPPLRHKHKREVRPQQAQESEELLPISPTRPDSRRVTIAVPSPRREEISPGLHVQPAPNLQETVIDPAGELHLQQKRQLGEHQSQPAHCSRRRRSRVYGNDWQTYCVPIRHAVDADPELNVSHALPRGSEGRTEHTRYRGRPELYFGESLGPGQTQDEQHWQWDEADPGFGTIDCSYDHDLDAFDAFERAGASTVYEEDSLGHPPVALGSIRESGNRQRLDSRGAVEYQDGRLNQSDVAVAPPGFWRRNRLY